MSAPENDSYVPPGVLELAASCARFVQRALRLELDFTPDTLPLLDHYLQAARSENRQEILGLIAPAAGAYFGEVVRRSLGPCHWHWEEPPSARRLEFARCFLSFNPIGSALEAILGSEVDGYAAHLTLLPDDRPLVKASLERVGAVREDDYFRLAIRYEALDQVVSLLVEKALAHDAHGARFGPETYAVLRQPNTTGHLH